MAHDLPSDITTAPKAFAGFARRINALLKLGRAVVAMKAGKGLRVDVADGNILITLLPFEIPNSQRHPFRVIDTSEGTLIQAAIVPESYLHASLSATSPLTITDLAADFALTDTTHVWIEVTVNASLVPTAAERVTGTAFPELIEAASGAQTKFNIPVGRVVEITDPAAPPQSPGFDFTYSAGQYHFEQLLMSHLLASSTCNNGTPALYAFPWSGR